ncbi:MAG: ral secretory pathway protein type pilus assembly protein PilB [Candidatus Saccharibacteria bacterium]|nr:ral secretory pathway protein type pilus assembly protein PilB [Candidatus Saccharibacteria bacterium]
MNVLSPVIQTKTEDILIEQGLLDKDGLQLIKNKAKASNQPFFSVLLNEGHITDEQLTKALARANNIPYVNLSNARIQPSVLELLDKDVAEHYMAVPIGEMQTKLVVAMLDADNVQAVDFLSNKIGRPLKVYAASESGVRHVMEQYDATQNISDIFTKPADLIAEGAQAGAPQPKANKLRPNQKVQTIVQDSPITKALSGIMDYAARNRASDIHIEPLEEVLKIRVRVDGVLREIMKLPKSAEAPLISRIKILSNLKIDEHRTPQDGQFTISLGDNAIDIRVAISPVVWGEQVVMRLLDKSGTSLNLEDMGYTGRALRTIRKSLQMPHGMLLTSGPTGSGKSTSMYAMLSEIKSDSINIVTLEDPVEYKIEGVNQIQVNPDVGLTFATGLRSILRQDPDVVMIGEIRDKETASLAVQAALTGHLVFATLHTNSAAGILPRLLDMGIEPFLIASTVHTVIGQRLVRRLVDGGEAYQSNSVEVEDMHKVLGELLPKTSDEVEKVAKDLGYDSLPLATQSAYTLYKGKETPDNPTGYKGRIGLYEVFEVTEKIQDLILRHSPSSAIQKEAQAQGMITMRQDGYLKALAGMTTLAEVNRVASGDS